MQSERAAELQVPDYVVGERLGAGGFGEVYRARHALIGRDVAIKVLHAKYSSDASAVARFVAEARAVNLIKHPNIVEISDFGTLADGRQYCVMELIEGRTLRDLLRERPKLALADALPILRGIAEAIDAARAAGVAHRDLKPDNVFVLPDGSIKLIDFGLAKLATDEPAITETGAVFGTPLYMSPEQCRGKAITPATDAYSFGVLAYQLLTGTPPFTGEALELALHHLNDTPEPASARNPELEDRVDRVLDALLAKDPAARPASMRTAVSALAGETRAPRRRFRLPRYLVAVPVLAALVVAGAMLRGSQGSAASDACVPGEARLVGVWDPFLRAALAARFGGHRASYVGPAGKVLQDELDTYTARWSKQWDSACRAPDKASDPLLYAQRVTCLENALLAVRGVTGAVLESDPVLLAEGYSGHSAIPLLDDCESEAVLRIQPPAPRPEIRERVSRLVVDMQHAQIALRTAINAQRLTGARQSLAAMESVARQLDSLGVPEAAMAWYWRAYELFWLAGNYSQPGPDRFEESRDALNVALRRAKELRNDAYYAATQFVVVKLEERRGDRSAVDAALTELREAVDRAGRPKALVSVLLGETGNIATERRDYDTAEATYQQKLAMRLNVFEDQVATIALLRLNIRRGTPAKALAMARALVQETEQRWGPDHSQTQHVRDEVADLFRALGDMSGALAEDRKIVESDVVQTDRELRALREHHINRDVDLAEAKPEELGRALTDLESLDREAAPWRVRLDVEETCVARGLFRCAERVLDHVDGTTSPEARSALAEHRASLSFMKGDLSSAATFAAESTASGRSLAILAATAGARGARREALARLDAVAQWAKEHPGNEATVYLAAAWHGHASHGWARAAEDLERLRAVYRTHGNQGFDAAEAEALHGDALVHLGRSAEAIEPLEAALADLNTCCYGFHYVAPLAKFALARALIATGGDKVRAHKLAEAARDGYARLGPFRDDERHAVERWLAANA